MDKNDVYNSVRDALMLLDGTKESSVYVASKLLDIASQTSYDNWVCFTDAIDAELTARVRAARKGPEYESNFYDHRDQYVQRMHLLDKRDY